MEFLSNLPVGVWYAAFASLCFISALITIVVLFAIWKRVKLMFGKVAIAPTEENNDEQTNIK